MSEQARPTALLVFSWAISLATWAAAPIGIAEAIAPGAILNWLGTPLGFFAAALSSVGFFPLFAFLMNSAEARGGLPESRGDVSWSVALRSGAEECLYRGLLLPAIGLGPQAMIFALAHAIDFSDPGLKVARALQCLLRGLAYGSIAGHFGFFPVAIGVIAYDLCAFAAVALWFGSARSTRA